MSGREMTGISMTGRSVTWVDEGFIAFDTETTGVDSSQDRIVTAAAVTFIEGEPTEARDWLIRVDVEIPLSASEIHVVTTEASLAGVDQLTALAQIRAHLVATGRPIVCFNSAFDIGILDANLNRLGLDALPEYSAICAMVLDKQFNRYVRGSNQRRLKPTAERYGISLADSDWHGAEADARVTGQIFLAQARAFPAISAVSPKVLAGQVERWREQQQADFQAWLSRQPALPPAVLPAK